VVKVVGMGLLTLNGPICSAWLVGLVADPGQVRVHVCPPSPLVKRSGPCTQILYPRQFFPIPSAAGTINSVRFLFLISFQYDLSLSNGLLAIGCSLININNLVTSTYHERRKSSATPGP